MASGITRSLLDRWLAPLFACPDCEGRGEREHAVWPAPKMIVTENGDVEFDAGECQPHKEFKTCETCRGSGRSPI